MIAPAFLNCKTINEQANISAPVARSTAAASAESHSGVSRENKDLDQTEKQPPAIQKKLSVGSVNDPAEVKADEMADKIMRSTLPGTEKFSSSPNIINRKCASCEEEEQLQRKQSESDTTNSAPPIVYEALRSSAGRSMDNDMQSFMGSRFNYNFTNVIIHDTAIAAKSAEAVNALAYTSGNNIVFNSGQYNTRDDAGKRLLAHELTHVVQQGKVQKMSSIQRQSANENPSPSQLLRFDVLGSDYPVNKNFAQAAALEPGIDLHVTSLTDLIGQLNSYTNTGTNRCVGEINFWNHGSPNEQDIAGTEEITRRDGTKYKLPTQKLTLDFLLNEKNLSAVENFRNLFCCNGIMRWLGCGTAGVQASGGLRSTAERKQDELRYQHYGHRYQSIEDALQHGAQLEGAQFGFLNAQSWANAVCVDVIANNDFTYQGPSIPGHHYKPGFGGTFQTFHSDKSHCSCDAATGRAKGDWAPTAGKKYVKSEEAKVLGPNYLWHLYLDTFRTLQSNSNTDKQQLTKTLRLLLGEVLPRVSIPAGLPVKDFEPWINSTTNTKEWAGATLPQLVFCFPDNCWHWIAFNQNIIKTTPDYTIQAVEHELMHAMDMWTAAQKFKISSGNPPANTDPDICNPTSRVDSWKGDFGDYVRSFITEYQKGVSPTRHVDIYAASVENNISNLTYKEVVDWFGAMLTELPLDLPANTRLKSEAVIETYFINPQSGQESLRDLIADTLTNTAKEYILETPGKTSQIPIYKGRGHTLLNHFMRIWKTRKKEFDIFKDAIRDE